MSEHNCDESERPTLPFPVTETRMFDPQTESFLSDFPTWPEFSPVDLQTLLVRDEAAEARAWWAEERRRGMRRYVTAMMAVCAGLLAVAVSVPLIGG